MTNVFHKHLYLNAYKIINFIVTMYLKYFSLPMVLDFLFFIDFLYWLNKFICKFNFNFKIPNRSDLRSYKPLSELKVKEF